MRLDKYLKVSRLIKRRTVANEDDVNGESVGQKIFLEDIMKTVKLPLLIVTTAALGSINSCVLTVEYAINRGLSVRGIVVNRYGDSGNLEMEDDNIRMMQKITGLEILAKVRTGDLDLGVLPF